MNPPPGEPVAPGPQPPATGSEGAKPPRRSRKRLVTRMLIYGAIAYTAWCATLYFAQDKMLFPGVGLPAPAPGAAAHAGALELRRPLSGDGSAGEAFAWYLPAPGASAQRPAPLVVCFHGNYETIDNQGWMIELFHGLGCSVLLPEFRGYGGAGGSPSQAAIREDAAAFLNDVLARPEVDSTRVLYYGRSLGGGAAADLASVRKPAAIVIESSFSSVRSMSWRYSVPPLLVTNPFRTDCVLASLGVPVLIFHGTLDSVLPISHARALHAGTPGSELWEFACGHDDPPSVSFANEHRERLETFLRRAKLIGGSER